MTLGPVESEVGFLGTFKELRLHENLFVCVLDCALSPDFDGFLLDHRVGEDNVEINVLFHISRLDHFVSLKQFLFNVGVESLSALFQRKLVNLLLEQFFSACLVRGFPSGDAKVAFALLSQ